LDTTAKFARRLSAAYEDYDKSQDKEQDAQPDGDKKQGALDTAPGGDHTAGILAGQPTQANAFVLQYHARDQRN
jgi:hypothetical protein